MQISLQIAPPDVPRWVQFVSQGSDVLAGALGLLIAYLAYRGYRRNKSRAMLFISIGFILAIGLPFALILLYIVLPSVPAPLATAIVILTNLGNVLGLACIVYAIWLPAGSG